MNLASFEILLLFCCTKKDRAKLAQYIPFVRLFPTQTLVAVNKELLRSDTRIGPMLFPSCALEYWSDDSGLAGFFFGSSKKIYNPHYFETLDFISAEELTWEMDPEYVSVEFGSKSWQRKEFRRMRWASRKIAKKEEKKEGRAKGILPPRRRPGTNNRWIYWKPRLPVVATSLGYSITTPSDSIPSNEDTLADTFFFSMLL